MKKIKIGDKTFKIKVINDPEGMRKGLSGMKRLASGHGLLFDFEQNDEVTMNMYDMDFPLDMLFINEDMKVIKVILQ